MMNTNTDYHARGAIPKAQGDIDYFGDDDLASRCPECQSNDVVSDEQRGERVCSRCGLVIQDHVVNPENERRSFTQEERDKRSRTGAPVTNLSVDMGLTTVIGKPGQVLTKSAYKWHNRLEWAKRNVLIATNEIKRIGSNLSPPRDVLEDAAIIYKKANKKGLLRGRSIKAMVIACLYSACRLAGIPRTLQEILDESNVDSRDVRKAYRTLIGELHMKVPALALESLVPRLVSDLRLSSAVERRVVDVLKKVKDQRSNVGKDPKGIVAAALYLSGRELGEPRSQQQVADVVGVTEVTLRSRAKEMQKLFTLDV